METMRKQRLPECFCAPCVKWRVDPETLNDALRGVAYSEQGSAMRKFWDRIDANEGCDFCGSDNAMGVLWIPDIIMSFFELERLCIYCRSALNSTMHDHQWPICWSNTPDEEIKWFCIAFVLDRFKSHFVGHRGEFVMWLDCCVKGTHAKRAPVKPEPYKWPEPDWLSEPYEAPDLKIELKPEFRKPRVRAPQITTDIS